MLAAYWICWRCVGQMIARLPPWKNLKRPRLYSYGSSHGFLRGLSNQESLRATKRREREREKEKSNSMRPPFLHTCYVTRNRWVENSREFDRREKLLAFSATSWSPCRGTWKLNRVGSFGFFSSLVLFFVTFSRICCECLRANLWLLSEIFLKIFFFFF